MCHILIGAAFAVLVSTGSRMLLVWFVCCCLFVSLFLCFFVRVQGARSLNVCAVDVMSSLHGIRCRILFLFAGLWKFLIVCVVACLVV